MSETALIKRFSELSTSQQSVETISLFLLHHRRQSQLIVHVWAKELIRAPPQRKIAFLYVANDVIQNDKRKGGEFVRDFLPVLAAAVEHIVRCVDNATRRTVKRIIQIWNERQIYELDAIKLLKLSYENGTQSNDTVNNNNKNSNSNLSDEVDDNDERQNVDNVYMANRTLKRSATNNNTTNDVSIKRRRKPKRKLSLREETRRDLAINPIPIPIADELVKMLQELENSPSSDAVVREKIAALPPEVSDVNLLKTLRDKAEAMELYQIVTEAHRLLDEYNLRLESELRSRRYTAKMLQGFIQAQERQNEYEERLYDEYKVKLPKLDLIREEIEQHRQNMPDCDRIQDDLAPLPSAGDLFSK
ncbi:unnamed protein product [Didymodactylos carnosus]|uniref:CID domain-containing protein n=1 Tax=Didymodactylos carnosus TaxID=1234261 RepID=A0A813RET1_9BILA|nr:unnamed protein product [Didymodactylos carnosus]CAF0791909.1 unnamed protein product [Didymodactylos carnosus]CAF3563150.1 unnamed protein product [Didymodactylos carnosus]CAF3574582.1 unnamed protein product [Didymodactylos carnosus]